MKIIYKTRKITECFIQIDGKEVPFYKFIKILEEIQGASSFYHYVTCEDEDIEKILIDRGILTLTNRGEGYCKNEKKRSKLLDEVNKLYYSLLKQEREERNRIKDLKKKIKRNA
jgi:hypothetical protein